VCLFLLVVSEDNAKEADLSSILVYEIPIPLKMQTKMYQIGHNSFNVGIEIKCEIFRKDA